MAHLNLNEDSLKSLVGTFYTRVRSDHACNSPRSSGWMPSLSPALPAMQQTRRPPHRSMLR